MNEKQHVHRADELEGGQAQWLNTQGASLTVSAFMTNIYLPYAKNHKRSWRLDERLFNCHIAPTFAQTPLVALSEQNIQQWLQDKRANGLCPSSCNRVLALFKTICTVALKYQCLGQDVSPCKNIREFKVTSHRERYLNKEEVQGLMQTLQSYRQQEALVLRLLVLTGARKSEILCLRWEYVHLDERYIVIPLSKSGKPRTILLSDQAIEVIQAIERKEGCPWLFPNRSLSKPLTDIYVFWNKLRQRLNLGDVRIHDLRHTFASALVNTGHSLYAVQHLLGHSNPRMTMRYAHLSQTSLLLAVQSVSSYLQKTVEDSARPSLSIPKIYRVKKQGHGHAYVRGNRKRASLNC